MAHTYSIFLYQVSWWISDNTFVVEKFTDKIRKQDINLNSKCRYTHILLDKNRSKGCEPIWPNIFKDIYICHIWCDVGIDNSKAQSKQWEGYCANRNVINRIQKYMVLDVTPLENRISCQLERQVPTDKPFPSSWHFVSANQRAGLHLNFAIYLLILVQITYRKLHFKTIMWNIYCFLLSR